MQQLILQYLWEGITVILLKEIYEYLIGQGFSCELKDNEIELILQVDNYNIPLILRLPNHFPYEFIEIYMYDCFGFTIPHRYTNNMLCIYDRNEVIPNPEMYLQETVIAINRAKKLINDSIKGNNSEDINKECVAIWNTKQKFNIKLILENSHESQILLGLQLLENDYIVSDNYKYIETLITYTYGEKHIDFKNIKCFFCKIEDYKMYKIPKKLKDVIKIIFSNKSNKELFLKYMAQNYHNAIIILSFNNGISNCLVSFKMKKLESRYRIIQKKMYAVLYNNQNKRIIHGSVTDLSTSYISKRGGDGLSIFNSKCIILGCGSVGSFTIKALVESGISKNLSIVDNEFLSYANIGRHICDLTDVFEKKVNAIKKKMTLSYPGIECNAINMNVYDYLDNYLDFINTNDFLFVVVGNENIEKKIIKMMDENLIQITVIIIWIEPYLVSGNAIILQNKINNKTLNNLFDDNGKFKVSTLDNNVNYLKSEAGCQSAYAPYSGFDVQRFILNFVNTFKTKFYNNSNEGNYLYTWLGNMRWARQNNIKIKPEWRSKDDGFTNLKRIDI